jgi:neutral ceramidase
MRRTFSFACILSLGSMLAVESPSPAAELGVGVATVDITPPTGYRMAGYFVERVNAGTKDPLMAKAIAFRQGDQKAALVFCDLVSVPADVASRARARAAERTGIPADRIAVAATHSHTGPLYHGVLRRHFHEKAIAAQGRDPREEVDYPAQLVEKLAGVVAEAQAAIAPARLEAGTGRETRLAFNRRFHMKDGTVRFNPGPLNPDIVRPAGPIDPEVGIILVEPASGGPPRAGLAVFAMHLDTVGGTSYSADYPYFLESELRKAFGPQFVSLFGAGTCGNINHIDVTTKTRASTETLGTRLAETVLAARPNLKPVESPSLAVATATVEVPLQRPTDAEVDEARKLIDQVGTKALPFLEQVRVVKVLDLRESYPEPAAKLDVQAFRLGPELAIVTLPGEVFVEHGLAIKRGSPFAMTFVVELANANPNYIPDRKAYTEGGYEAVNSRLAPGGGEMLVETALRLLKGLK